MVGGTLLHKGTGSVIFKPLIWTGLMNYIINDTRVFLIKLFYSHWIQKHRSLEPGYTILLPTPSDLPVFLALALEVISKQDQAHLKEIIVIPDWPSSKFERYFETLINSIKCKPIRFVNINNTDKLAWKLTKSITTRHFTQIVRGIDETTTLHAIIHDSDLFLPPGDFLLQQFLTCRNNHLVVYGLDMRRSLSRFDRKEFVATWEMTCSTNWFRSFPPYMHKGQVTKINGRRQEFDTTLLPQYLTDPSLISWKDRSNEYVHFSYVIASYRNFINKKGYIPAYSVKLFLIRTLVDVFDFTGWEYRGLPEHEEFLDGKHGVKELVADKKHGGRIISEFKQKIDTIINNDLFPKEKLNLFERRTNQFLESVGL